MRYAVWMSLLLNTLSYANLAMAEVDVQTLRLQKSYLQAIDCRAPQHLAEALKQSLNHADDWVTKSSRASVFEEMMMQNPACFVKALNTLPKQTCQRFASEYLNETFFYPRQEVQRALSTASGYDSSCIAS